MWELICDVSPNSSIVGFLWKKSLFFPPLGFVASCWSWLGCSWSSRAWAQIGWHNLLYHGGCKDVTLEFPTSTYTNIYHMECEIQLLISANSCEKRFGRVRYTSLDSWCLFQIHSPIFRHIQISHIFGISFSVDDFLSFRLCPCFPKVFEAVDGYKYEECSHYPPLLLMVPILIPSIWSNPITCSNI